MDGAGISSTIVKMQTDMKWEQEVDLRQYNDANLPGISSALNRITIS